MPRLSSRMAKAVVSVRRFIPKRAYYALRATYQLYRAWRHPAALAARAYVEQIAADAPLNPDEVLYESFHGKSFNCSPAAICLALLDDPAYAHLTHIWAVNDPSVLPEALTAHANLRWVLRNDPAYGEALATAGTIITNTTLEPFFTRRDGQVYANTWHGVPLKRMFKHEGEQLTRHANSQRNFLQASHLLMPNTYTADALMTSADVDHATQCIITGAPRVDLTLDVAARDALRAHLGIKPDCQVIMVAPTWRGTIGDGDDATPEIDALLDRLNGLDADRYVTFVQMHDFVATPNTRARALPAGVTTNQFLAAVDILITDYSSIMFDMLATGRQVILFAYDHDHYRDTRGLIADLATLPAPVCATVDDVMDALAQGRRADADPRFAAARDMYFPDDDGHATSRAITAVLAPAPPKPATRPKILIFGGAFKNNGITSSVLNLLGALGALDVDVYLATNGAVIDRTPEYADNIRRVHPNIHILHRAGGMNMTPAERHVLNSFYATNTFADADQEAPIKQLFAREARRMFGDMQFDAAVDFSGYSRFWSMLIAATPATRHVIYQHNDMLSEANIRFDILRGVFAVYRYFDAVVSVSEPTRALNLSNLGDYYASPAHAVAVRNMIDPAAIVARAGMALPDGISLADGPKRFVSVGRMSGEKAQSRMIEAIANLRKMGHDATLVLIGDGPLRDTLTRLAKRLGISDHIVFTGQQPNPFAIMARCDCFVLSSDYEGQPMVLLEALCLGLPIVATDIAGTRSVLDGSHATLVSTDTQGVTDGMLAFLTQGAPTQPFDAGLYCNQVLQEFLVHVAGQQIPPAQD